MDRVKHGRKEQFSITIDTETADKFYEYQEKHNIMFKNMAMEQLLQKAFLYMEFMETNGENQLLLFKKATDLMSELIVKYAPKNRTLMKAVKVHYEILLDTFSDTKVELDIN